MDTKSKALIGIFFVFVVAATVWKYYIFVTKRDFIIYNHISCNPNIESCFTYDCDPLTDAECDPSPFKKIIKNAQYINICYGEDCPQISCSPQEEQCEISICSDETVEEGEVCVFEPPLTEQGVISETE